MENGDHFTDIAQKLTNVDQTKDWKLTERKWEEPDSRRKSRGWTVTDNFDWRLLDGP